jgi:hypothetical protein
VHTRLVASLHPVHAIPDRVRDRPGADGAASTAHARHVRRAKLLDPRPVTSSSAPAGAALDSAYSAANSRPWFRSSAANCSPCA